MTQFTSYQIENNITGVLVNADFDTSDLSLQVQFTSPIDNSAVTPDASTLIFAIRQSNKFEQLLATSHSTSGGVTTIVLDASNGRLFNELTLTGASAGTDGFFIGARVELLTTGTPTNALKKIVEGTNASGGTSLKIGDETAADISYQFANDHSVLPRLYWDDSDKRIKASWGDDAPAAGDIDGVGVPQLTTTERDAITWPAGGVTIYNTTLGQTEFREGGTWVTNAVGGTVPDATESVAGKVEFSDETETEAGTTTGGTGASLVSTPARNASAIQKSAWITATDTGAADAYAIAPAPAISAYSEGMKFRFKAVNANTGASTLNVNAVGAITILKSNDQALEASDVEAGQWVEVIYDGTNFQMVSGNANLMSSANSATLTAGDTSDATNLHRHDIFTLNQVELRDFDEQSYIFRFSELETAVISAGAVSDLLLTARTSGSGTDDGAVFFKAVSQWEQDSNMQLTFKARKGNTEPVADTFQGFHADSSAQVPTGATDVTRHIGFYWDFSVSDILYASCADGTTQTTVDISSAVTDNEEFNTYEIIVTGTSQADFYVNGTLAASITTNLPTFSVFYLALRHDSNASSQAKAWLYVNKLLFKTTPDLSN